MNRTCQALCISIAVFWAPSAWAGELSDWIEAESNGSIGSLGGYYADFSLTLSPYARYYESGLRFRFTASETLYTYPGDAAKTFVSKGQDTQTDFLLGYNFAFDRWSLLLLAGPSVTWSVQRPGDLSPSSDTTRAGAKGVVSIYANPTEQTMLYAEGSYSSQNSAYYSQVRFGGAVLPAVYVGPEMTFSGRAVLGGLNVNSFAIGQQEPFDTGLQQWKAGGFISGLKLGPLQLGFSAGYLNDRQQGNGAYVGTSARTTF